MSSFQWKNDLCVLALTLSLTIGICFVLRTREPILIWSRSGFIHLWVSLSTQHRAMEGIDWEMFVEMNLKQCSSAHVLP